MKLIKHECGDSAQVRIEGHLPKQNPLGDKTDARLRTHAGFQPYLITHDIAEMGADFFRDAFCQHACREPAWLKHDYFAFFSQQPVLQQHLRNLRGFA